MPLRSGGKRRSDTDSGCDTLDSTASNTVISSDPLDDDCNLNDDDDGEDDLLESLGIEDSEIKKINNVQVQKALIEEYFNYSVFMRLEIEIEDRIDLQSLIFSFAETNYLRKRGGS